MQIDETTDALIYKEEQVPIPTSKAGLLRLLSKILSRKHIALVNLSAGQPMTVGWHRTIHDAPLITEVTEDIETTLARIDIVEGPQAPGSTVYAQFVSALHYFSGKQLVATHIVVSEAKRICDFFNLPWSVVLPTAEQTPYQVYAGLFIVESPLISDDSFVILGAPTHGPDLVAVTTAVRIVP